MCANKAVIGLGFKRGFSPTFLAQRNKGRAIVTDRLTIKHGRNAGLPAAGR